MACQRIAYANMLSCLYVVSTIEVLGQDSEDLQASLVVTRDGILSVCEFEISCHRRIKHVMMECPTADCAVAASSVAENWSPDYAGPRSVVTAD